MHKQRTIAVLAAAFSLLAAVSTAAAATNAAPTSCPKDKFLAKVKDLQVGPKVVRVVMVDPKTDQPVDDLDVPRAKFDKDFKGYKVGAIVCHREPGQE